MMLQRLEAEIRAIPLGLGTEGRREYRETMANKIAEYKEACLAVHGLLDHPKADAIWELAWEEGHSASLSEVEG